MGVWFSSGDSRYGFTIETMEKKRETRKPLSQPGWIMLEGGFAARQCVVQDLSTTGAKVTIDDPNSLPAKLKLAFCETPGPGAAARWSGAVANRSASSSSLIWH